MISVTPFQHFPSLKSFHVHANKAYHLEEESYEARGAMWGKSEIEIVRLAPGFRLLVLSESHGQGHLRIGYSARMVDYSRLFA